MRSGGQIPIDVVRSRLTLKLLTVAVLLTLISLSLSLFVFFVIAHTRYALQIIFRYVHPARLDVLQSEYRTIEIFSVLVEGCEVDCSISSRPEYLRI